MQAIHIVVSLWRVAFKFDESLSSAIVVIKFIKIIKYKIYFNLIFGK